MDSGSPPPNPNGGYLRWQAGKPVRKTASSVENHENNLTRQYVYVRRDDKPAPVARKRKTIKDHRPAVTGPLKRYMTEAEVTNRNKLVKKPMKQRLLSTQNDDEARPPPPVPVAHCSNNPPPNLPEDVPPPAAPNNARARLAFDYISCGTRCRKEGCQTIPRDYRLRFYEEFTQMTNDERYFVMRSITYIKRDAGEQHDGGNNKTKSWRYNLVYLQQHLQVCRNNFLGTLGISKSQVDALHDRMGDPNESIFFRNMTGRHDNRPHKMTPGVFEHVIEFLAPKDRLENHYSRGKIDGQIKLLDKKYTYAGLYKEYDAANQVPPFKISHTTFKKIMNCEGYFVGDAYIDTCGTCDRLQVMIEIASPDEKNLRIQEKEEHLKEVELAKIARASDIQKSKDEENFVVLTVDMMQTIFSPKLTCGPAFYLRKFATNNFGVHDERTGKGFFYIWHEVDAKKGGDEIASAIFTHIRGNFDVLNLGEQRTLVVYSDRCVGQNNNFVMLVLYRKLIAMKYFTDIHQKFVISGHSYLSPDRDFGVIEKVLRRITVKVPTELQRLINDAAANFQATKLRQQSFFNFEPLAAYWTRPANLHVTKWIHFYQHDRDSTAIYTKKSHDQNEQYTRHVPSNSEDLNPKKIPKIGVRKYEKPLRLDRFKKEGLMKLMRWLTPAQRDFYLPHILPDPKDDDDPPRGNDLNLYGRMEEHPFIRIESIED